MTVKGATAMDGVDRLLRETRRPPVSKETLVVATDRVAYALVVVGLTWAVTALFPTETPSVVRVLFQGTLVVLGLAGMLSLIHI